MLSGVDASSVSEACEKSPSGRGEGCEAAGDAPKRRREVRLLRTEGSCESEHTAQANPDGRDEGEEADFQDDKNAAGDTRLGGNRAAPYRTLGEFYPRGATTETRAFSFMSTPAPPTRIDDRRGSREDAMTSEGWVTPL